MSGFSAEAVEVLKRKPLAKYGDFTSGNRVMWRKRGYDSPLVVFFDKEPGLLRPPDILCEWTEIPRHFPRDYFRWGFFDPPHTWFSPNSIHNKPGEREKGIHGSSWWGNGGSKEKLKRDIVHGQRALSEVTPILLFKWNETSISLNRILTCFTEFRETRRILSVSPYKRGASDTWWVRLARR